MEAGQRTKNSFKNWYPQGNSNPCIEAKLLNKLTVSELAELSKLSKAYISQVKHGKRPASQKLIGALNEHYKSRYKKGNGSEFDKAIDLFLKSRPSGTSTNTISFYKKYLSKAIPILSMTPTPKELNSYLNTLA
ncbi:hypothetical protein ACFLV4_03920, partial [Chloroflexota bacterium]